MDSSFRKDGSPTAREVSRAFAEDQMTKDEIIRMAREARLAFDSEEYPEIWQTYMYVGREEIERFATLVAEHERKRIIASNAPEIEKINAHIKELEVAVAAERETCAELCEMLDVANPKGKSWDEGTIDCANAIRARGQA